VITLVQLTVAGLALGALYGLIAVGFVIIYRATRVFNFAHGEMLMFGAFVMVGLLGTGLPWGVSLVLTVVATGILGAGFERVVLRRFVGQPVFVTIIVTILFAFVLRVVLLAIYGVEQRGLRTPWDPSGGIGIAGVQVTNNRLATILAAGGVLLAVYLILQRTRIGVAMRAAASDQEAAMATGIPVGRIIGTT
jgi:branched-chain amino acid transport system permease protein